MLRKVHFYNDRTVVLIKIAYDIVLFKHLCLLACVFRVMFCDVVIFHNMFRTSVQKSDIITWCRKIRKLIVTKGQIFNDLLKLINRCLIFLTHAAHITIISCDFFRSPFFLVFWCKSNTNMSYSVKISCTHAVICETLRKITYFSCQYSKYIEYMYCPFLRHITMLRDHFSVTTKLPWVIVTFPLLIEILFK